MWGPRQHCKLYLLGKVLCLGISAVSNSLRGRADLLSHVLNALVDLQKSKQTTSNKEELAVSLKCGTLKTLLLLPSWIQPIKPCAVQHMPIEPCLVSSLQLGLRKLVRSPRDLLCLRLHLLGNILRLAASLPNCILGLAASLPNLHNTIHMLPCA